MILNRPDGIHLRMRAAEFMMISFTDDPVIVYDKGVSVVDARIILKEEGT